jgi:hypothetical protein
MKRFKFKESEEGGLTLEAALVLPLYLSFILLLITMIRISLVEMSLNQVVNEATRQVATHMYPIGMMYERSNEMTTKETTGHMSGTGPSSSGKELQTQDPVNSYSNVFPTEVKKFIDVFKKLDLGTFSPQDQVIGSMFKPIVDYYANEQFLNIENLRVTKVTIPNLRDGTEDQAYFGIDIKYELPLHIPFVEKTLIFKQQAYERVWLGDSLSTALSQTDQLVILSITSPIQRGRTVTITATGPPNQTATITINYKSGFVKSEECSFDGQGKLSCQIKIGGNSNLGIYEAVLQVEEQEVSGYFEVLSKDEMGKYVEDDRARKK